MAKTGPIVSERERTRIENDYYTSDTSEFQTYSQDDAFVNSLITARR